MLKALAEEEVTTYFATHDIVTLLGEGRSRISDDLHQRIQQAMDSISAPADDGTSEGGLGLEVVYVSVVNIYPPAQKEVAASFHQYIAISQQARSEIQKVRKEATSTLAEVAGSAEEAVRLRDAMERLGDLKDQLTNLSEKAKHADESASAPLNQQIEQLSQQVKEQQVEIEQALNEARGLAAQQIYEARAYYWQKALAERGRVARVKAQAQAYNSAPKYFRMRYYLSTLADGLQDRRKFIVAMEGDQTPTIELDMKSKDAGLSSVWDTQ